MVILSKGCKPDDFESHNSLKLSFTNSVDCGSFLKLNSPDILAICEPYLDESIDSDNFSVRGYFPFIQKDCATHMHVLTVYVKERLPFARDLSRENCRFLLVFSTGFTSVCLTSFFSIDHLFCLYARLLILFHLIEMRFSRSTHLLMCLCLETLTSIMTA